MLDSKVKIIIAVFAIICLLYIVHFSISYINSLKRKEHFREERETFEGSVNNNQYAIGLTLLNTVDSLQNQYNLTKSQKNEVVTRIFTDMDSYKGKDQETIQKNVTKVINDVINGTPSSESTSSPSTSVASPSTTPSVSSSPSNVSVQSSLPQPSTPPIIPPPVTPAVPPQVTPSGDSTSASKQHDSSSGAKPPSPQSHASSVLPKIIEVQKHISAAQSLLDEIRADGDPKPSVETFETFEVEGFENNVRFSNF